MSRTMLAVALAAAALVAGLPALRGQEGEKTTTRFYDISALTMPVRDAEVEPFGTGWPHGVGFFDEEETEPVAAMEEDSVVDFLRSSVAPESWAAEDVSLLMAPGGHLLVRQTEPVHREIAEALAWLGRSLAPRVEFEVHWLTYGPESVARLGASGALGRVETGRVPGAAVAELLAEAARPGNGSESGSGSSVLGRRGAVRRTTFVTYVEDYDVEIAQAAQIGDPIVKEGREGVEVYVRPLPLLAPRALCLEVLARTGRFARPMRTLHLEAQELGILDLPDLDEVTLSTAVVVDAAQTSATPVWRPHGDGGPALAVLLVSASRPDPSPPPPAWLPDVLDVGFLTRQPREYVVGWSPEMEGRDRQSPKLLPVEESAPAMSVDAMVEVLREFVQPPDVWEEEGTYLYGFDGRLLLSNRPEIRQRARALAREIEDAARDGVRVDARFYSVPAEGALAAGDAIAPGPRPDARVVATVEGIAGARLLRRVSLDALAGRWAACLAGRESSYVHDYDVEVAQEARISDPIVGEVFDGLVLNARPTLSGDEVTLRLGIRLAAVDPASLTEPRRTGSEVNGVLNHPREKAMRYNGTVAFPRGGCQVIDGGSSPDGEGRRLVLVVSAR